MIKQAGATLDNFWEFVDGTVRLVCRPSENQRVIYNGHKRVHSIKFQAVTLPNGLVGNLFGPIEGRCCNSFMLAASGFFQDLQRFSNCPVTGKTCCRSEEFKVNTEHNLHTSHPETSNYQNAIK